ncbi:MAG: HutD family protein [Burkholderiales bacterium]|nr:HutD family protein [Burkholderiales bacterium]
MSWNLVSLADVAATPWKNGGGVTRELLAWPSAQDWRVRISVAEVEQDGPFSRFDGVQRWFAVLHGAGVRLDVEGRLHELTSASEPLAFDGGAATNCTLIQGATRDFNLMSRGGPARLQRVRGTLDITLNAMTLIAAYAGGERAAAVFSSEELEIPPATLAWRILDANARIRLSGGDALWMEAPA